MGLTTLKLGRMGYQQVMVDSLNLHPVSSIFALVLMQRVNHAMIQFHVKCPNISGPHCSTEAGGKGHSSTQQQNNSRDCSFLWLIIPITQWGYIISHSQNLSQLALVVIFDTSTSTCQDLCSGESWKGGCPGDGRT